MQLVTGKRMKMNREANKRMKAWCESQGITRCENCNGYWGMSFAHRQKRRFYNTVEELSDPSQFLLLCAKCHSDIEYSKTDTARLFKDLRDEINITQATTA